MLCNTQTMSSRSMVLPLPAAYSKIFSPSDSRFKAYLYAPRSICFLDWLMMLLTFLWKFSICYCRCTGILDKFMHFIMWEWNKIDHLFVGLDVLAFILGCPMGSKLSMSFFLHLAYYSFITIICDLKTTTKSILYFSPLYLNFYRERFYDIYKYEECEARLYILNNNWVTMSDPSCLTDCLKC